MMKCNNNHSVSYKKWLLLGNVTPYIKEKFPHAPSSIRTLRRWVDEWEIGIKIHNRVLICPHCIREMCQTGKVDKNV